MPSVGWQDAVLYEEMKIKQTKTNTNKKDYED